MLPHVVAAESKGVAEVASARLVGARVMAAREVAARVVTARVAAVRVAVEAAVATRRCELIWSPHSRISWEIRCPVPCIASC